MSGQDAQLLLDEGANWMSLQQRRTGEHVMPKCELNVEPEPGNPKLKLGDILVVTHVPVGCIYAFEVGDLYLVSVIAAQRVDGHNHLKITDLKTGEIFDPDAISSNSIKVRVLSSSEPFTVVPN